MIDKPVIGTQLEQTYVSLAEALTSIAFGQPLDAQVLKAQVEGEKPINSYDAETRIVNLMTEDSPNSQDEYGTGFFHDRQEGLTRLIEAWQRLREAVERGTIKVRGRHTPTYSEADASLANVEYLSGAALTTFSQFDVSTGGIRRRPLSSPEVLWRDDTKSFDRELDSFGDDERAADGYLFVEVERSGLPINASIRPSMPQALPTPLSGKSMPTLPDAMLKRWYEKLPKKVKSQPLDRVLVPLCQAAHPEHIVSRQRIRDLFPNRKRGPKPFRGDSTA